MKEIPIPKSGQNAAEFIKTQAEAMVREMFSQTKIVVEIDGPNLYILDFVYDVWPEDEDKGKSAKVIFEIVQHKIREYTRIHDEYEYEKAEFNYDNFGVMKILFYFKKQISY